MIKSEIVERLVQEGLKRDRAVQYADLFEEYSEASENISRNGSIVQHPRTMNPIDNPYLKRRDSARKGLEKFRYVQAEWLWKTVQ